MNYLTITLNITEGSILISESILEVLGYLKYIKMLINKETKSLLLKSCSITDRQALVVPAGNKQVIEISGRALMKKIGKLIK